MTEMDSIKLMANMALALGPEGYSAETKQYAFECYLTLKMLNDGTPETEAMIAALRIIAREHPDYVDEVTH